MLLSGYHKTTPATRYLLLLFVLAFYYLSYRYPFQINSSTTSPTYSDTPALLQWLKYLIFLSISALFFLRYYAPLRHITNGQAILAIGWALTILLTLTTVILHPGLFYLFEVSIFSIAFIVVIFCQFDRLDTEKIFRAILWFIILSYVINLLQLGLFLTIDRLPALAYPGSIFVRFGALWDDPNSYALFHAFIFPFIAFSPLKKHWRVLLMLAGTCSLLLSQSISGAIGTLVGVSAVLGLYYLYRPLKLIRTIIAMAMGVVGVITLYGWEDSYALLHYWYELKEMSVERRGNFISDMFNLDVESYLGLAPTFKMSENGHMLVLSHLGFFPFLLFFYTAAYNVRNMNLIRKSSSDPYALAIAMGALGHTIGYTAANFGVPSIVVFPLNIIFMLTTALGIMLYRNHILEHRHEEDQSILPVYINR